MNDIQESLLQSMQLLAESAAHKTQGTMIIDAEIAEILDEGKGLYSVNYTGNKFEAYAIAEVAYSVGDKVSILIPNGDFSSQKKILGGSSATTSIVDTKVETHYVQVSENLLQSVNNEVIQLCTYTPEAKQYAINGKDGFSIKYPAYAKEHTHFAFSADFKTNIPMEQRGGDFGLSITLPYYYLDENDEKVESDKTYTLNIEKLKGNPYQLLEWTPQSCYFEIPKNLIFDNSREVLVTAYTDEKFTVDAGKTGQYDIFIKNIGFNIVDVLTTDEKNGYYLSIMADTGSFFLKGEYGEKTLTPHLRIKNRATSVEGYPCYWFVEDSSVEMDSPDYLHQGGLGWRCLNEKSSVTKTENGTIVYNYVTNKYSHVISDEDVYVTLRYKCVVDYNGYLVSSIIEIINLNNDITIELVSNSGSFVYPQGIGSVNLTCRITGLDESLGGILSYNWERHDKEGERLNYEIETVKLNEWNGNVCSTEIKFKTATVDFLNTVYCTVTWTVQKDGQVIKRILGTRRVVVSTSNDFTYRLEIDNDNVIYKYDPDGNSPMVANYDGAPTSVVKSIQPLGFRIFRADGTELTSDEYLYCKVTWIVPKESLIEIDKEIVTSEDDINYYVETTGNQFTLPYGIANCYNARLKYGTIMLEVVFDNSTLTQSANIAFLKDGESGTNGTKYAVQLTCNDYAYGEKREDGSVKNFTPVFAYQPGAWYVDDIPLAEAPYKFDAKVYRDGALVNNSIGEYSVELSMLDPEYTNPCFSINSETGKLIPLPFAWQTDDEDYNLRQNYCNILVAKVTIKDVIKETDENNVANFTNSEETIYSYYPIDIGYVSIKTNDVLNENNESETVDLATAMISGGFGNVLYASDGTNPKYDNTNVFIATDNYGETYYTTKWSVAGNLTISSSNSSGITVMPFSRLENGVVKNLVRVNMTPVQEEITNTLSKLRSQKRSLETRATNINAEQTALTNFLGAWDYKTWANYLEVAKPFIIARGQCIAIADDIIDRKINAFQEYCNRYEADLSQVFDYKTLCAEAVAAVQAEIDTLYAYGEKSQDITAVKHLSASLLEEVVKNENEIKSVIGISAYQMIYSYAYEYRTGTVLFNNAVNELESGSSTAKVRFLNLANGIKTFITSSAPILRENALITPQYKDIIDIIEIYFNFLTNKAERIYTYDDIRKQVLDATYDLIKQYGEIGSKDYLVPTSYINNYYANLMGQNDAAFEEIEAKAKHYKAAAASTTYEEWETVFVTDDNGEYVYDEEGNPVTETQLVVKTVKMFYLKPVVMIYNRYEMAALNGWDGNKLYTDDAGTYLLAPQIGAGKKELDNSFTGIVMGTKKVRDKDAETGLFGFGHGIQTIFLDADTGKSEFGASGSGQIIIDPTQRDESGRHLAVLKSGNYHPPHYDEKVEGICEKLTCPGEGMLIDLTTPGIYFGTGNFSVDAYGNLTAKSGQIANCTITEHGFTNLLSSVIDMRQNEETGEWEEITISSLMDATNEKIEFEVKRLDGDIATDRANMKILNNKITLEVEQRKSEDETLKTSIEQNANQIVLKAFANENGEMALAQASLGTVSTEDGPVSFFQVGADSIALRGNEFIALMSGGEMMLGAGGVLSIYSDNFTLGPGGFATTGSGSAIQIGNCTIDSNNILDVTNGVVTYFDKESGETLTISTAGMQEAQVKTQQDIISINGCHILTAEVKKTVDTANGPVETHSIAKMQIGAVTDPEGNYTGATEIVLGADNIALSAKEAISFMAGGDINLESEAGAITITSTNFKVDDKGNVSLTGKITAKEGTIGGWAIEEDGLYSTGITIKSGGSISGGGNTASWSINADGSAVFNNINVIGGSIGELTVKDGWLICGDVEIDGYGLHVNYGEQKTTIDSVGITTNALYATGGTIGNLLIKDNGLYCGDVYLGDQGIIIESLGNRTYLGGGEITTNALYATGGEIGGWTIEDNGLSAGDAYLGTQSINMTAQNHSVVISATGVSVDGNDLLSKIQALESKLNSILNSDGETVNIYKVTHANGGTAGIFKYGTLTSDDLDGYATESWVEANFKAKGSSDTETEEEV